jgi:serine/threonine protein kinase
MADRVEQQFGQYRMSRFLGQGSFGEVYLGEHIYNHTLAAVKVLQARLTAEDLKEFINEASTTFRLQHPHIVQLLDFGISPANTPFLVMAYAAHGTLRQRHPKGTRLSLEGIVAYVSPIATALQHAHNERLVHRDVKPENILLGPNDEVWLSDFGITSAAHSTRSLDTERPGGTVPYMAPEQLRGKARAASDQYALGIMVYEWLCGERPFSGTATEIAMQHFLKPPPSLHEKMPTIAPDVEHVVMTALAKDPAARWTSVQAFATALHAAVTNSSLDTRSARAGSVSETGMTSFATVSPEDGASPPNQTKGQGVPTTPPLAVVGNLEASAQNPLSEKLALLTAPYTETAATLPASPGTKRPSAIIFSTDGRTIPSSPLPVTQRKRPLHSTTITPNFPPRHMRLPSGRAMVLVLLVLIVVCSGGIWATLYVTTHRSLATPTATTQNIFQMTAVVGHRDSVSNPSIFFAFDLQGQATIVELPGGDVAYSADYLGPLLSGSNVSVTLRFQKVIGSSLPDMVVYAGQDIEVFGNNGHSFSLVPSSQVQQGKLPGPTSSNVNYPLSWASAVVGHDNDSAAHPSDFLAANIRGQISVYEFPGGDASYAIAYAGPDLIAPGDDQKLPTLSFSDVNHDGKIDMILTVAGQQFVFYNTGTKFVPTSSLPATATSDPTPSGKRAEGVAVFTNQGSVSLVIPTSTLVATDSGILFETVAEVSLPPGGSIFVPVLANSPGAAGNVPANSITVIPQQSLQAIAQYNHLPLGNLYLTVTNDSPTTGGVTNNSPTTGGGS